MIIIIITSETSSEQQTDLVESRLVVGLMLLTARYTRTDMDYSLRDEKINTSHCTVHKNRHRLFIK